MGHRVGSLNPVFMKKKFLYGTCNVSKSVKLFQKKKMIVSEGGSGHQYFKNGPGDSNVQPRPENTAPGRSSLS